MPDPIRALIVDDEPAARKGIRELLRAEKEVEVVGECRNGYEAVAAIQELDPDLVFLDIQMPEMDGFGVIREIGSRPPPSIVFVTAYDEYALRAFEVHALDYLLKPFSDDRFREALAHAREQIRSGRLDDVRQKLAELVESVGLADAGRLGTGSVRSGHNGVAQPLRRLSVRVDGRVVLVPTAEIDWIGAEGDYVSIHAGRAHYQLRETMKQLETQLDPARFVRIHRSTIVNVDRIRGLEPYFRGEYVVVLQDGMKLKLSRRYRGHLESALGRKL